MDEPLDIFAHPEILRFLSKFRGILQRHPDVYREVSAALAEEKEQIAKQREASVPHP